MTDVNGQTPEAAEQDPPAAVPVSERLMGAFGLAVAVGIGLIALDLLSGGAVSRALGRAGGTDGG